MHLIFGYLLLLNRETEREREESNIMEDMQ